ncbi:MAG: serine/threonine protein kinase [Acidobacteria bacterium]|nr:serine/threonine protein kinase [Acidobacteriota bacterium]
MMQLGPFRLISRLGAGGMGEVWRAEDARLLRAVAVKILPEGLANDADFKTRFLREARMAAQLNHPNIATIYAVDEQDGRMYIAMELVNGDALSTLIREHRLGRADAVRIARSTAEALAEAHEHGIIHRDIKPENIIVSPRAVKVLDFGIARHVGPSADSGKLTEHGMILGTPHYMSPEQALGRTLDTRTDIFSLGVVLYEALSGKLPFSADTVTATMMQTILNEPADIAKVAEGIPEELAAIVRRCLQKKPEERYKTADEVAEALAKVRVTEPARPRAATTPTVPTPPAAPPAVPVTPAATPVTMRALIVDDDEVTRTVLGGILMQHRVEYDEANNGAEAIQRLKQRDYGLLFLDLLMPRIDGWGVLDYLRGHRAERHCDVFLISGIHEQRLSVADQELVSGQIDKPFDHSQIGEVVEQRIARGV